MSQSVAQASESKVTEELVKRVFLFCASFLRYLDYLSEEDAGSGQARAGLGVSDGAGFLRLQIALQTFRDRIDNFNTLRVNQRTPSVTAGSGGFPSVNDHLLHHCLARQVFNDTRIPYPAVAVVSVVFSSSIH